MTDFTEESCCYLVRTLIPALDPWIRVIAEDGYSSLVVLSDRELAERALDAVPDGWAKVDGKWIQITSDGVGYGEFDRVHLDKV